MPSPRKLQTQRTGWTLLGWCGHYWAISRCCTPASSRRRACSVQARCRVTKPDSKHVRGACDPQSRCKAALAGMSLVDIVNMTDSERRERVPIDGQRKRLVACPSAHTHAHTRTHALSSCPRLTELRLIYGSRLRRCWLYRRSVRARRRSTRPPPPLPLLVGRHHRSSTIRPPPSTSTRPSRRRARRR